MRLIMPALFAAAVVSVAPASAETAFRANVAVERIFGNLDLNGDETIDAAERAALRERRFARLDANGDGIISAAETAAAQSQIQKRAQVMEELLGIRLVTLDSDTDGIVTRAEFEAGSFELAPVDLNADGRISKDEMRQAIIALPAFE